MGRLSPVFSLITPQAEWHWLPHNGHFEVTLFPLFKQCIRMSQWRNTFYLGIQENEDIGGSRESAWHPWAPGIILGLVQLPRAPSYRQRHNVQAGREEQKPKTFKWFPKPKTYKSGRLSPPTPIRKGLESDTERPQKRKRDQGKKKKKIKAWGQKSHSPPAYPGAAAFPRTMTDASSEPTNTLEDPRPPWEVPILLLLSLKPSIPAALLSGRGQHGPLPSFPDSVPPSTFTANMVHPRYWEKLFS